MATSEWWRVGARVSSGDNNRAPGSEKLAPRWLFGPELELGPELCAASSGPRLGRLSEAHEFKK